MKSFLVGLGIGFGLGMLFAPMRGEDIREVISARASELGDSAREGYAQVREKAQAVATAIRGQEEHRGGESTGTEG